MQTRPMGEGGRAVAVIGQGTWNMELDDRDSAIAALRAGIDAGMTHIDTAEMYGDGRVEELVGEAVRGRRDELFIVSKVLPSNASRKGTIRACERSLERLGTDRLDVYLLHWRGASPLEETLAAFDELRDAGKILAYGVSNFGVEDLEDAATICGAENLACNQVLYHLEQRAIEHEVVPWCADNGVAVVAYSPFGSGDFPAARSHGGQILAQVADECGATARQVALAFLTREPVVLAIPKAAQVGHAVDNSRAGELRLSPEQLAAVDGAFVRGPRQVGVPLL